MGFSEKLKSKVKKKAHFTCCLCKTVGIEVHHIIPKEAKGRDTEDNAAPLCPTCHEIYGANPNKRKFIREARNLWYEVCATRFGSDHVQLEEIKKLLRNAVSYSDFTKFKKELFSLLSSKNVSARTDEDIGSALSEFLDKIWYNRHLILREKVENGTTKVVPRIWKGALRSAKRVENQYGLENLGPWSDFEWGMLNGKVSALRWVWGDEWDMLDT